MPTLDVIYTTDEAVERLRLTRRALLKLARDTGACSKVGRNYLFSEDDLLTIWQAMRADPPARDRPGTMRLRLTSPDGMSPELAEAIRTLRRKPRVRQGRNRT